MNQKKVDRCIIDQIEKVRGKNNILWMQILRLAIKHAPDQTKKVLNRIRSNDIIISFHVEQLAKGEKLQ